MKLTELDPQFIRFEERIETHQFVKAGIDPLKGPFTDENLEERTGPVQVSVHVETLREADGIVFLCPMCAHTEHPHSVKCWFEDKVPDDVLPGPGRWKPIGTGYADLSFVAGKHSPSVQLIGGCAWHGFVTCGEVT